MYDHRLREKKSNVQEKNLFYANKEIIHTYLYRINVKKNIESPPPHKKLSKKVSDWMILGEAYKHRVIYKFGQAAWPDWILRVIYFASILILGGYC